MTPLHLALGGSAAGCVRAACRDVGLSGSRGESGDVFRVDDDYSHGPLCDGPARDAYLAASFRGYDDEWPADEISPGTPWRDLGQRLAAENITQVCIWAGENASERTFLAAACWHLRDFAPTISIGRVGETGLHEPPYIAVLPPAALAALYEGRTVLAAGARDAFADEFARLCTPDGLLRQWRESRIITVPLDTYDHLLVENCPHEWTRAAQVVGTAMGFALGRAISIAIDVAMVIAMDMVMSILMGIAMGIAMGLSIATAMRIAMGVGYWQLGLGTLA